MISSRWMVLPVILTLSACGTDEFDDLQKFVKESGADMRGNIEKPPEIKPYEPFTYNNPDNLPDPFRVVKVEQVKPTNKGNPLVGAPAKHDPEDLENYALESLKMIGFVRIHGVDNAIVSSPDGKVYHVKAGNYMGQNFGKIESITETEITLQEKVLDSSGAWTDRTSTLEIQE
jgi:type IV pilus assembly protein PilP